MGFVIDSLPFTAGVFDPSKFRRLSLKDNCIDAGFTLPDSMVQGVSVSYIGAGCRTVLVRGGDGQVRTVDAGSERPHMEEEEADGIANVVGHSRGLRKKLSSILPRALGKSVR